MEFPEVLKNGIEHLMDGCQMSTMKQISASITYRYKNESGAGQRLITKPQEAKVYSVVRMPVTYAAIASALSYALEQANLSINSLLDAGAGTGAASFAADSLLPIQQITCIEREQAMRDVGKELMQHCSETLQQAKWIEGDIITQPVDGSYDLVISSYMLNELSKEKRTEVIQKLWNASNQMLLIVEPGTKAGYSIIKEAREQLLAEGGHIAAPCPCETACPMSEGDWCHFTCRVARSRLHRIMKEGEVPYEDEKFSYLAMVKQPLHKETNQTQVQARILRHPQVDKGRIGLTVCSMNGICDVVVKKKDGKTYPKARKVKCGNLLEISCCQK